ncbi:MAG: alpha/beta fold hydrolase, partial [Gammaproteobacteria bacterium]|nr:alpha/beta fold hydrolase [Gammaproteobacteria bacterium]
QALGAENARQTVRELRKRLFAHGEPEMQALRDGLALLKQVSLRDAISQINLPVLLINGRLDSLVPVAAGEQMQALLPNAELHIFDKAGHAPFLSHANEFITVLKEFLNVDVSK